MLVTAFLVLGSVAFALIILRFAPWWLWSVLGWLLVLTQTVVLYVQLFAVSPTDTEVFPLLVFVEFGLFIVGCSLISWSRRMKMTPVGFEAAR